MALWRVAREAVAVGVAKGGGIAVVVLWAAQHLSRRDPCPGGGGAGGEGTRVLRRGGAPHAGGRSGRGALEWSKHWTSAVQYFSSDASLIQSLREP